MTFIPDLEPCYYFSKHDPTATRILAVGWLEGSYPYPRGAVDATLLERLVEVMALSFWIAPVACLGHHHCTLGHDEYREQHSFIFRGRRFGMGAANLFLPGGGFLFAAPSLIVHYVRDHAYLPPEAFRDALLTCPPIGSPEYNQRWEAACPAPWRGHIEHAIERSREQWKEFQ